MFKFFKKKKGEEKDLEREELARELDSSTSKAEDYEKETEKNVAIHVMPERFRAVAGKKDKAKTVGILIIGGGVLIIISVSFLLYFYLLKGGPGRPGPTATSTEIETPEIRKEEKPAEPTREPETKVLPPVATSSFITPPLEGEATSTPTLTPAPVSYTKGADQDSDGLTDKEEVLFGSSSGNSDSDNDGYADLSEVYNLYNPAGREKLEAGSAIKKYSNNAYQYSLLYPARWTLSSIGGDDSVIIRSNDNHFIQIIVQPNSKKEPIEDWYKAQFSMAELLREVLASDGWRGIKSDNDLILYLADSNNNYLYTITYNLGENTILEYKNVFEMMIKSFVIKI